MFRKSVMFCPRSERVAETISNVMFIDPGLQGTGWAFFPRVRTTGGALPPEIFGVIKTKGVNDWENRTAAIINEFAAYLIAFKVETVVMEFPELWVGSSTSMASGQRGDLFKLTFLIGGMAEAARRVLPYKPVLVHPRTWKGQLSKEQVIKRVCRIFGWPKELKDHEADAVGMGLAAQGGL